MQAYATHLVPHHAADIIARRHFASPIRLARRAHMTEVCDKIKIVRVKLRARDCWVTRERSIDGANAGSIARAEVPLVRGHGSRDVNDPPHRGQVTRVRATLRRSCLLAALLLAAAASA